MTFASGTVAMAANRNQFVDGEEPILVVFQKAFSPDQKGLK
jgi:hypothetical protein